MRKPSCNGVRPPKTPLSGVPRRLWIAFASTTIVLVSITGTVLAASGALSSNDNAWPYAHIGRSPVLAAVGDIACQPGSPLEREKQKDVCDSTGKGDTTRTRAQAATADQIERFKPDLVAILGDEQYQVGRYQDFTGSFDTTYGAFKFLQRPAPGNHEFYSEHGETGVHGDGYFDYYNGYQHNAADGTPITDTFTEDPPGTGTFTQPRPRPGGQAGQVGDNGNGWYSYNLGSWHIISLNVECAVQPGGCNPYGSWFASETRWLARDLAGNHAGCTLAYWHQPTFSVADTAASDEGKAADRWWKLLYRHGADLVLNGHDHTYARYAPMDPTGHAEPSRGIREFIVGTGGESLDPPVANANTPNLQAATGDYYGAMRLTLRPRSYDWDYESAIRSPTATASEPSTYTDTGSGRCHGQA